VTDGVGDFNRKYLFGINIPELSVAAESRGNFLKDELLLVFHLRLYERQVERSRFFQCLLLNVSIW